MIQADPGPPYKGKISIIMSTVDHIEVRYSSLSRLSTCLPDLCVIFPLVSGQLTVYSLVCEEMTEGFQSGITDFCLPHPLLDVLTLTILSSILFCLPNVPVFF